MFSHLITLSALAAAAFAQNSTSTDNSCFGNPNNNPDTSENCCPAVYLELDWQQPDGSFLVTDEQCVFGCGIATSIGSDSFLTYTTFGACIGLPIWAQGYSTYASALADIYAPTASADAAINSAITQAVVPPGYTSAPVLRGTLYVPSSQPANTISYLTLPAVTVTQSGSTVTMAASTVTATVSPISTTRPASAKSSVSGGVNSKASAASGASSSSSTSVSKAGGAVVTAAPMLMAGAMVGMAFL